MRVEYVVSRSFRYSDVLRNGFHLGVAGAEEFFDRIWNLITKPTQFADNGESVQLYGCRPNAEGVRKTNIVGGAFRPQQVDVGKDSGYVFHVHAMRSDKMLNSHFLRALLQMI